MAGPTGLGISFAISNMLHESEGAIAGAINKQTSMKAWMFVGIAIVAIVFFVKKMGR